MKKNVKLLKNTVLNKIIPKYENLGKITGVYIKGSLVDDYTSDADFDVSIVWEEKTIPLSRKKNVAEISSDKNTLIVDYRDVHMDRFISFDQEFNISHLPKHDIRQIVKEVQEGNGFESNDIINPLIAVSSFYYGVIIQDESLELKRLKAELNDFPVDLLTNVNSYWKIKRAEFSKKLNVSRERNDLISFSRISIKALDLLLLVIYTKNKVYFPGYKWTEKSFKKHNISSSILQHIEAMLSNEHLKDRYEAWIKIQSDIEKMS